MPVFSRMRDGVLVLTVDGDYTVNEIRRIGFAAFEAEGAPKKIPVILDLSGAAGIASKSAADLAATGAIFGAYRDRLTGLAIVAPSTVASLFDTGGEFAREAGGRVQAFPSHTDAKKWLGQGG